MSGLEWLVQGVLLLPLATALPFVLRLHGRMAGPRLDPALAEGAAGFERATREAQASLEGMGGIAGAGGRQLSERMAAGESLRDDLHDLTERAVALADRLEAAIGAARPLAGSSQPAGPSARSSAERELLQALAHAR